MIVLSHRDPPPEAGSDPYAAALRAVGGKPILLGRVTPEEADAQLEGISGVCFCGGGDIHADYSGRPLSPLASGVDRSRDEHELALFRAARARGLPILGICRGCQLINVASGGTLYQDIEHEAPFATLPHRHGRSLPAAMHEVRLAPNSRLATLAGSETVVTNSHHHQAVERPGDGLRVVGWARDGIVEAVLGDRGRVLGVQWHAELMEARDWWPFAHLVRACMES